MWKKYILWRQYEPFFTGWMDMMIFATILFILGVGPGGQDPAGAMLFCYGGIGLMVGLPMGGFYSCVKRTWVDKDIHSRETLKAWKNSAESIVRRHGKKLTWDEVEDCALNLMVTHKDMPVLYACAAILTAHEKIHTHHWMPKEAYKWRALHPKVWNIMGYF
ncbi:hypothetical protein BIZ78_gp070 [Erwinia phage vB_EamM_Caitlin]|uniref:hypothetical protein n=1 Tax=Erwinia phage vB_EamM_Caitlin TaxID=1883379 RepID=UPI00081C6AC1|nr:hypothetical protein BIZ78_gp070 [Erwinia phage vB_EamM_Caitlin]ANZ48505.1 hypothetical protein CAITLIN_210 [Erwinia phage vB_EamM_Caitlin]